MHMEIYGTVHLGNGCTSEQRVDSFSAPYRAADLIVETDLAYFKPADLY